MVPRPSPTQPKSLRSLFRAVFSASLLAAAAAPLQAQVIHELAGPADALERPSYLAIDDAGRVYVAAEARGVLKVIRAEPDGQVAQIYSGPGIHFFGLAADRDRCERRLFDRLSGTDPRVVAGSRAGCGTLPAGIGQGIVRMKDGPSA